MRSTTCAGRQQARLVDHPAGELGEGLRGGGRGEQQQQASSQHHRHSRESGNPALARRQRDPRLRGGDGVRSLLRLAGVLKSTLGASWAPGRRLERHLGLGAVEDLGADRVGEGADAGVIALHRLIIVAAGDQDRIFGALDLALQRQEILVGLELRIGLLQPLQRDDRLGQPALGIVERADLGRIVEVARR